MTGLTSSTVFIKGSSTIIFLTRFCFEERRQRHQSSSRSKASKAWSDMRKLTRSPRPIFVDQANYLQERSLGTLCFLWEKRHIPIVLVGTKTLFDNFYQSKLTEDVRGQLTSRIALHYLLPELTKVETEAIIRHALGAEVTDEMVEQIHQATGGNFRSVDMIIPRILELEQRNRQRLADGAIRMDEIIKVAAARLMI
jgi:DNA transposition AAA+ family ATPase